MDHRKDMIFSRFIGGARRLADTNPIVAFSWFMGGVAVSMPFVVPPVRKALGLRTNQYSKRADD